MMCATFIAAMWLVAPAALGTLGAQSPATADAGDPGGAEAPQRDPLADDVTDPVTGSSELAEDSIPGLSLSGGRPSHSDDESPTLFVNANNAFAQGEFSEAAQMYQLLVGRGHDSGWLHYNLGNAYLRNNQLGLGIASLRRANNRLPRAQDVQANLNFARSRTQDAIGPLEAAPFWRTVFFWHFGLSYHELTFAAAGANAMFWVLLALQRLRRDAEALRFAVGLLGLCGVLLTGSLIYRSSWQTELAVVRAKEIDVHSGTSLETVVRFKLHDGSEARVVDTQGPWLRIELVDGKHGWVMQNEVARLTLI